jgi:cellulose synthase/poly-beta-1,6-N-acetylglucosamine synthase-like glycosyltransferase
VTSVSDDELVTVVIPALNEERFLGECLDSVRAQDYRALQIIVVDGGSTDGTVSVVESRIAEDERIELLHNDQRNIPSSLNLALDHARGEWLVRVDAHSTVGQGYVRKAVERLREGTWAGVGGRKDGVGRTSAGRAIAAAMGSRFGVGDSTYHHGTSAQEVDHLPFGAYPVDLVRKFHGWNEQLVANEDFEFDYRLQMAGLRLLFDPRIVIHWHCRQSIPDLYRQYERYGRGKVDVARIHPESMRARHMVPPALVVYVAVAGLLSVRRPARWLALMAPYELAVVVASLRTGRQLDTFGDRARLPFAFMAMHLGWGVGFCSGVVAAIKETLNGDESSSVAADDRTPSSPSHP